MKGKRIMLSGYGSEDGTLDYMQNISEGVVTSDDGRFLKTGADGAQGISGAPMFDLTNFSYSVVGIAVAGARPSGNVCGPKINTTMINLINNFNSNY